jgi:hypothetical protein
MNEVAYFRRILMVTVKTLASQTWKPLSLTFYLMGPISLIAGLREEREKVNLNAGETIQEERGGITPLAFKLTSSIVYRVSLNHK